MAAFLSVVAGLFAGRLVWIFLRHTLSQPVFLRENYRGLAVPTACGIVLPLAVLLAEGGRVVLGAAGLGDSASASAPRLAVLVAAAGLGLVGLLDDLAGSGHRRGFRGHVSELGHGRMTTGGAKLVIGAFVAVVAVSTARPGTYHSVGRLLLDAALVALAANLGNLFDRAPGRAAKVGIASYLVLAVATGFDAALGGVGVVVGATLALLPEDLRERAMLGDTGANVLGGAVGLGVVATCSPGVRVGVLVAVAALNVLSELVSFSRVIDGFPPLRAADRAGRGRPAGPEHHRDSAAPGVG